MAARLPAALSDFQENRSPVEPEASGMDSLHLPRCRQGRTIFYAVVKRFLKRVNRSAIRAGRCTPRRSDPSPARPTSRRRSQSAVGPCGWCVCVCHLCPTLPSSSPSPFLGDLNPETRSPLTGATGSCSATRLFKISQMQKHKKPLPPRGSLVLSSINNPLSLLARP